MKVQYILSLMWATTILMGNKIFLLTKIKVIFMIVFVVEFNWQLPSDLTSFICTEIPQKFDTYTTNRIWVKTIE